MRRDDQRDDADREEEHSLGQFWRLVGGFVAATKRAGEADQIAAEKDGGRSDEGFVSDQAAMRPEPVEELCCSRLGFRGQT